MSSIEQWWRDGAQLELALNGSERHIFVRRRRNAAPHMTLLHGFPSSSHDWAKVAPALAERFELLAPDFLGFGASDLTSRPTTRTRLASRPTSSRPRGKRRASPPRQSSPTTTPSR